MKTKIISLCCALTLGSSVAIAASGVSQKAVEKKNEMSHKAGEFSQDHSAHKTTADSQMKGTDADVAVTRKIRDRLTDMDGLSMKAQNVTIVTKDNNITLKGEVDKQEEIQKIMNVAQEEASGKQITNQLKVQQ